MSEPLDGRRPDGHDAHGPRDEPGHEPGNGEVDDLTRALTAPGTPDELADSERYLAMFRAEHPAARPTAAAAGAAAPTGTVLRWRRHAQAVRRVGARTVVAGALAVAVAGSGVAAAYAGSLPAPLQRTAHRVLGPVGVPAAVPAAPEPTQAKAPKPSRTPDTSPATSPSAEPTSASSTPTTSAPPSAKPSPRRTSDPESSRTPSPTPSPSATLLPSGTATPVVPTTTPTDPVTPTESTSPTAGPTDVPTTPAPTVAPVAPRAITITSTSRRAVVDGTLALTGTVSGARGRPSAGTIVLLEQGSGRDWRRVASETTDDDGRVTITSLPLTQNTGFRLTVDDLHSRTWRVQVTPTVSAEVTTVTGGNRPRVTVSVTTDGARPGDLVRVLRSGQGGDRTVGRGRVGSDGTVTITVPLAPVPAPYAVLLPGTRLHTSARAPLSMPLPSGQPLG